MVNKYIGDAILAVFGVPLQQSDHAEAAIRAALGMRLACRALNLEFARDGFPAIRIGIGIHTGDVVAGNIGTRDRVEYTVIGDTVNVASRIEGLCKDFQQDLLISEQTMVAAHYGNRVSRVASVQVKGRLEPVNIYTIAPEPGIRHGTAF
jgi:adenylate cyclase